MIKGFMMEYMELNIKKIMIIHMKYILIEEQI